MKPLMTKQLFEGFFPENVLAFQSDRSVNFALSQHQHGLNEEQKEALDNILNEKLPKIFNVKQVHEDRVVFASSQAVDERMDLEHADAVLTDEWGLPIAIRTADCLPVFLYDPTHRAIGLAHCGWKSTHKHILKKVIHLMEKYYQTNPSNLKVSFGPAIHNCHYQVGIEFKDYFPKNVQERDGSLYLDLIAANKEQLFEEKIDAKNVLDCNVCTVCEQNCFSHRREAQRAGRMISVMMMKD